MAFTGMQGNASIDAALTDGPRKSLFMCSVTGIVSVTYAQNVGA